MVQIQTRLTSQTESTGRIKKSTGKCGRGHNISGWAARQLWLCTKGRYTELLPQPRREVRGWASPFSPSTNTIQKWIILQGNEHKKGLRRTWLPLRIVEEKVYCSYEGEHRQRWKHLGEHRVKMSPGHVRTAVKGEGRPENERSGGHKRTTGSYRKEPLHYTVALRMNFVTHDLWEQGQSTVMKAERCPSSVYPLLFPEACYLIWGSQTMMSWSPFPSASASNCSFHPIVAWLPPILPSTITWIRLIQFFHLRAHSFVVVMWY